MVEELLDKLRHDSHGIIIPDEIINDIIFTPRDYPIYILEHEPTGVSTEYKVNPYKEEGHSELEKNDLKKDFVKDNPEVLEYYDLDKYDMDEIVEDRS